MFFIIAITELITKTICILINAYFKGQIYIGFYPLYEFHRYFDFWCQNYTIHNMRNKQVIFIITFRFVL